MRIGNMVKRGKYNIVTAGIVSVLMILVIMLPSIIQNHGIFIIRGDYVDQYIPRLIKAKEIITSGKGTWDWFNFLGAPYNIISMLFSLNSVCLLFPSDLIPYAVTYMHLIRFGLIAITSYAYFSVMVKENKTAFLGAILYTFSSYTFLNFEFMQFMEALWTFPLILLSAEKMFRSENYKHQLIFSVFLSCTINFYFFVFSTLSFSAYFLCRFCLSDEWRNRRCLKYFFLAIFEYSSRILCAFIVFAPFIYSLFNSAGSAQSVGISGVNYLFSFFDREIISRIFSFFVPAASNRFSTFGHSYWSSRAAYIPVFGMSFVVAFFLQKHNNWLKPLCIFSIMSMIIPGISAIYNFLSSTYTRYAYSIILFFILATILFIENYSVKKAKLSSYFILACFMLLVAGYYIIEYLCINNSVVSFYLYGNATEQSTEDFLRLFVLICAAIMYIVLVLFINSNSIRQKITVILPILLTVYGCAYVIVNQDSSYLLDYFPESSISLSRQIDNYFISSPDVDNSKDYRIDFSKQCRNYSYTTKKPSISIFESVRNSFSNEFSEYVEMKTGRVSAYPDCSCNELRTLLGVKYYFDIYPEDNLPVPEDFTYKFTDNNIKVYENNNFAGMGFSYNSYMLRSEFDKIAETKKDCADIMLNTLIVEDEDINFVTQILEPYAENVGSKTRILFDKFEYNSSGFNATINTPYESIIYVSVPYERKGWKAEINGEKAEYINANIGFIAFKTTPGQNIVQFTYTPPSLKYGKYISLFGFMILAIYLLIDRRLKKKQSYNKKIPEK